MLRAFIYVDCSFEKSFSFFLKSVELFNAEVLLNRDYLVVPPRNDTKSHSPKRMAFCGVLTFRKTESHILIHSFHKPIFL